MVTRAELNSKKRMHPMNPSGARGGEAALWDEWEVAERSSWCLGLLK